MAHCEFTPEFKSECVRDIIFLLRSNPGRDEILEIVEHAACFLGCGAKMLRGSTVVGGSAENSYDEAADQLAAALPGGGDSDEELLGGIPWVTIAKILLPILLDLLTEENTNA